MLLPHSVYLCLPIGLSSGIYACNKDVIEYSTHSLTAALDQLRVVASSTSNDPGPRSEQHQQIGQYIFFHLLQPISSWTTRRLLPVSGVQYNTVQYK